ncbi:MAG: amidohydrolase [Acidobacteria bacterium]|nr:amidohydrolase [Acidobacteriota bacterium]
MRKQVLRVTAIIALVFLASACNRRTSTPADTVLMHARIYTVNANLPWAQAMAVREGKILAVGSDKEIAAYQGPSTNVIDAKGRMALPGFMDGHVHMMAGAAQLEGVSLNEAKTIGEFQKIIKDYAAAHPDKKWIQGMGWVYSVFGPGSLPDKRLVDEVVADRPVYLAAYDGHTALANSKALQIAGITRKTPNPPSGIIVRDPATGEATGVLKEAAGQLVARHIPPPTREEELNRLTKAIRYASSLGLTRLISAGADTERVELFDQIRQKGDLTARFTMAWFTSAPVSPDAIRNLEESRKKYRDEWIDAGQVKFLLDGVIEAHTAAMLEPYEKDPSNKGQLYFDAEKYREAVIELHRLGFPIATHAIGDRAIRLALDSYEAANKANSRTDARNRIEHIEAPSSRDIPRFGKLNVIASMQPLHATPDQNTFASWAGSIGPQRAERAFPWHSILNGGAQLSFGSDWPVVTLNPWPGVQMLLTRETPEGTPAGGWHPNERLSLEQAIQGYTMGAAIAAGREKSEGSIEVGKWADVILLSQDLFRIPANQIGKTKVLMTMVGGKIVYQDVSWDGAPSAISK